MHDTVWFEIQGIPSVAIASTQFQDAAETQANALGMKEARRVFVDHPIQGASDQQMCEKADAVVERVIAALCSDVAH